MKIAMIGSRGVGSNYGGIERVLDHLCPELALLGHEIHVYGGLNARDSVEDGVRSIPVPAIGNKHFENISRSATALAKAVRRYDLVHFHAIGPGILSLVSNWLHQPSVVTIHGLDHRRDKWGPAARMCLSMAERTLVANADAITVVSERLRQYFLERHNIRTSFIPNAVQRRPRIPAGPVMSELGLKPQRYLLFASRLTSEKGCHDLIAAFNPIKTDMQLVIAGAARDPAYGAALELLAQPGKVIFAGHRTGAELFELFSNAYLFVLPSYIEGMSMALLEALSFGLAALVSDIPENRAVVRGDGFAFPARDAVALRAQVQRLIDSPHLVSDMAERLRGITQPDWAAVASRYDNLYRVALNRRRQPTMLAGGLLDA